MVLEDHKRVADGRKRTSGFEDPLDFGKEGWMVEPMHRLGDRQDVDTGSWDYTEVFTLGHVVGDVGFLDRAGEHSCRGVDSMDLLELFGKHYCHLTRACGDGGEKSKRAVECSTFNWAFN